MNKTKFILLAATLGIALAFTVNSCALLEEEQEENKAIYGDPVDYGGETYKTVKIGNQTWMARNLNYDEDGSECYNYSATNCEKYGRLYDWATAMALPTSENMADDCNSKGCTAQIQTKHKGICPSGWHIPSSDDWETLFSAVGGGNTAGKYLKATGGWNSGGNGLDSYGFAALPGGTATNAAFESVGNFGCWVNTEDGGQFTFPAKMWSSRESANADGDYGRGSQNKKFLCSVRCLKN